MTAYSQPEPRDDPREARRASGVDPHNNPLYLCDACGRHQTADGFGRNKHGTVLSVCTTCAERAALGVGRQRFYKDRSHITVTEKKCAACGQVKPSRDYWLDGKEQDGLKKECGLCIMRARKARAGVDIPAYDAYVPASALQPALDQALSENGALRAELERTRGDLECLRCATPLAAHALDAETLTRLDVRLADLSRRLDQDTTPLRVSVLRGRGLAHLARLVGPIALRVFGWAEQYVDADEEDAQR